jgi:glycosyltransferase involved in cell wall biosynthesis
MSHSSKLSVLIATYNYSPHAGGVAVHVQEVAQRLAERGHRVTILTVGFSRNEARDEVVAGIRVVRLKTHPRLGKAVLGFKRAVRSIPHDIAHVQGIHTLFGAQATYNLSRGPNPCVITPHLSASSVRWKNRIRPLQWRVLGFSIRKMAWIFCLTTEEQKTLEPYINCPVTLKPNGADLPEPTSLEIDPNLLISAGRLDPVKRHDSVIRALPDVLLAHPDMRLQIVGSGPEHFRLEDLTRSLGLEKHVQIVSFANTDRVGLSSKLHSARLGISFSSGENNPIMVQEFLSTGRPMLLAQSPGLAAFVDAGGAFGIARDAKPADLAEAILSALSSRTTLQTLALPKWDEVTDGVEEAYRACLAQKS